MLEQQYPFCPDSRGGNTMTSPRRASIKVFSLQGAWGGGLLMSRKHRHKLSGVER